MQAVRPSGPKSAALKYDILSALSVFALQGDKIRQRRMLRLISLVTSRYNWQRDELSLGQGEIARLWAVDPRTVKREMAVFRALGWLVMKRQGVRGRVSVYGLGLDTMLAETRGAWQLIGPDFESRMGQGGGPEPSNVVPLRRPPPPPMETGVWSRAQAELHCKGLAEYGAWLHPLQEVALEGAEVVLTAPSRFHASYVRTHLIGQIRSALRLVDPSINDVRIEPL